MQASRSISSSTTQSRLENDHGSIFALLGGDAEDFEIKSTSQTVLDEGVVLVVDVANTATINQTGTSQQQHQRGPLLSTNMRNKRRKASLYSAVTRKY